MSVSSVCDEIKMETRKTKRKKETYRIISQSISKRLNAFVFDYIAHKAKLGECLFEKITIEMTEMKREEDLQCYFVKLQQNAEHLCSEIHCC